MPLTGVERETILAEGGPKSFVFDFSNPPNNTILRTPRRHVSSGQRNNVPDIKWSILVNHDHHSQPLWHAATPYTPPRRRVYHGY